MSGSRGIPFRRRSTAPSCLGSWPRSCDSKKAPYDASRTSPTKRSSITFSSGNPHFDKKGDSVLEGLLGTDDERTQAVEFVARPEIVKTYAHPDQTPPAKAEAAVARMAVVPWRTTLLAGLQKRFSSEANRKGTADVLRHCRIDRASFIYPVNAGLKLRFEGVTLLAKAAAVGPVVLALCAESSRLFVVPIPVKYDPEK